MLQLSSNSKTRSRGSTYIVVIIHLPGLGAHYTIKLLSIDSRGNYLYSPELLLQSEPIKSPYKNLKQVHINFSQQVLFTYKLKTIIGGINYNN